MITKHFPFFLAAVEEQSFHRAAERLHIAQSALSRRIGDLEQELGVALFERLPRGVRPTLAGLALAQDARRLMADVEDATERVRRVANGDLGLLRIGFTEGMMRLSLFPVALRRFRAAFPDVDLRVTSMVSEQQLDALRRGELDLGFVFEEGGDAEEFELRRVGMLGFVLVLPLSHPLADAPSIRLADLTGAKFIWPSRQTSPRLFNRMIAACDERGLDPDIVVEAASVDVAYGLVSAGLGLGVVIAAQRGREPPDVILRQVEDLDVPMPLAMAWRRIEDSAILTNFVRLIERAAVEPSNV